MKKRIENHIHIRHIMLFHFEKWLKCSTSHFAISTTFLPKEQFEKWCKKFKSGDTNLADEEGRSRPSSFYDQVLLAAVEEDQSLTSRMLAKPSMWTIRPSFVVSKSLEKYGNWLDGPTPTLRQYSDTQMIFIK